MKHALPEDLGPVLRHLEAAYPREGCGVIFRGPAGFRVVPMENVYDRYHAVDPDHFPRSAFTAYLFDPKAWLTAEAEADSRGETLACIFHSHVDAGAYFSNEDKAMAAPEGQPLYPHVSYLVVAIDAGRASGAKLFWWDAGGFAERAVPL